jgi:alkylation response protein AidB-like acyl-CoA dehydrogenase
LTEPSSGSDAASLLTRAVKTGGDYIIDGTKSFITMGGISDVYVVMARTGGDGPGGISAFLVDKSSPGLSFGKPEQKMGWRNQPTTTVNFDSVRVPESHLLGGEGEGFKIAMRALDGGRVNIAACSLGGGRRAMDMAGRYMNERRQFNKSLAEFQSLQFKMANMAITLDASRLMTHRAAAALDSQYSDAGLYAAMAKKMASESAFSAADEALQIHGGYGYIRDYEIERVLRDLRVNRILEGTNEIMQIIVARKILESYRID